MHSYACVKSSLTIPSKSEKRSLPPPASTVSTYQPPRAVQSAYGQPAGGPAYQQYAPVPAYQAPAYQAQQPQTVIVQPAEEKKGKFGKVGGQVSRASDKDLKSSIRISMRIVAKRPRATAQAGGILEMCDVLRCPLHRDTLTSSSAPAATQRSFSFKTRSFMLTPTARKRSRHRCRLRFWICYRRKHRQCQ